MCDVAHFATEWPWLPVAAAVLHSDLSGQVEVVVSRRRTDPWTWRAGQDGVRSSTRPAEDRGAASRGEGHRWPPHRHHLAERRPSGVTPRRSDRSPWNWLLLIPIVVPLLVPLYNSLEPDASAAGRGSTGCSCCGSSSASRRRRWST